MNQMDLVRDTIRHNNWATRRLIEHLQSLSPGTLLLSAEGTYGQIDATLSHLVRAERAYLARLRGATPQTGRPGPPDLAEISAEAQSLGRGWEELLETSVDPTTAVTTRRGPQSAGTILAQAINHGAEHRAHICTVLGAHGLQPPALDPFAYGEAMARGKLG